MEAEAAVLAGPMTAANHLGCHTLCLWALNQVEVLTEEVVSLADSQTVALVAEEVKCFHIVTAVAVEVVEEELEYTAAVDYPLCCYSTPS